jgi:hypothetical protein
MDIFNEYIVKRKMDQRDYAKIVGLIVGSVAVMFALYMVLPLLGAIGLMLVLPCVVGIGVTVWFMIRTFMLEYEYSVTNGYVVIDKIIARNSRKRELAFECRDVERLAKYDPKNYQGRNFNKVMMLDTNNEEDEHWCVEINHRELGRTLVVFTPTERLLAAMKPFLKRQVSVEAFGRN